MKCLKPFLLVLRIIYFIGYLNYLLTALGLVTVFPEFPESLFPSEFAYYLPKFLSLLHLKLVLYQVHQALGDPPIIGRSQCIQ